MNSTLKYENNEESPIEAVFTFPVDENSAVYKFEAEIEGRKIMAECQEKQQVILQVFDEDQLNFKMKIFFPSYIGQTYKQTDL